jgi:hypothetical protein
MTRKALGVLVGSALGGSIALAQPPAMKTPAAMTAPVNPAPLTFGEVVLPGFKDAVLKVVRQPTISTKYSSEEVVCSREMYEWLLNHPDRVSLAWRRMKVACVEINDLGNGRFGWNDEHGSELTWQSVGTFPDGVVWFATGKVKPSPVTPAVPVKAVVVLAYPTKKPGTLAPITQVYMHTDSRAASMILRMLGPTAPKLAEQGAEQLLFFFNGIGRYVTAHPEHAETMLAPVKK